MSKKREAAQSSCDEERKESVDLFEDGDNAKRTKLVSSSDNTRLSDLPMEMLQCILVRAVAMEVKSLGLAKVVWKEKADLVINRLRTVCSTWNDVLTTNSFRNEVHRILDGTAQPTIRLEILHQFPMQFAVFNVATLMDEIFLLCRPSGQWIGDGFVVNVCENNGVSLVVKHVIPIPVKPRGMEASNFMSAFSRDVAVLATMHSSICMEACNVSNCVYVTGGDSWICTSILRITKGDGGSFGVSKWIAGLQVRSPVLSVSASGCLILVSAGVAVPKLRVYAADGSLQHEITLSKQIVGPRTLSTVMQRPNGNLVLLSSEWKLGVELTEIDTRGRLVRRFKSGQKRSHELLTSLADARGRIYIAGWSKLVELVDVELNLLDFAGKQLHVPRSDYRPMVHFDRERNEVVRISFSMSGRTRMLTVFRFTEE